MYSEIGRRLLESSYNFNKSNEHETKQLCLCNKTISLIKLFNKCLVKLFASYSTSNTPKQARSQDFCRGGAKKRAAGEKFFWFVFTVVYGFLYYIVNVRYKD